MIELENSLRFNLYHQDNRLLSGNKEKNQYSWYEPMQDDNACYSIIACWAAARFW